MRTSLMSALLLATACATTAPQPASGPPRIAPGRASFEGKPGGYFIWVDTDGWHLRTTSGGQLFDLQGVVSPVGGALEDLRPLVTNDRSSKAELTAKGIEFSLPTQSQVEGFDWKATSGCNRFDLLVGGQRTAGVVRLGAAGESPSQIPFEVCK